MEGRWGDASPPTPPFTDGETRVGKWHVRIHSELNREVCGSSVFVPLGEENYFFTGFSKQNFSLCFTVAYNSPATGRKKEAPKPVSPVKALQWIGPLIWLQPVRKLLRLEGFQGYCTFFFPPKHLNLFTVLGTVTGFPCLSTCSSEETRGSTWAASWDPLTAGCEGYPRSQVRTRRTIRRGQTPTSLCREHTNTGNILRSP